MGNEHTRTADGSAGDADYGTIGAGYREYRRPEPEFERAIAAALGDARTVLNVGAGAGSYEPRDRDVTAVEPSAAMRAQRPADLVPATDAVAEDLPFPDDSFDAAMTTFSVHQWPDLEAGLRELRRVARGPVVVLTCDPALLDRSWLAEYAPEMIAVEGRRYPAPARIVAALTESGGEAVVESVPIPLGCVDGFSEAYLGRPEALLDPGARRANSAWSFVAPDVEERFAERLGRDLADGTWDARHGALRTQAHLDGSLVLVVARP
jgi:SAM-dependent methyltransferase